MTNAAHPAMPGPPEPVPLSVWPCAPDPPAARGTPPVPVLLLQRLIAVYSHPATVVLAAGADASRIADVAIDLGRRPVIDPAGHPRPFPAVGATRAALIIATPPAVTCDPARYTRWARALTPTGILTVLTPALHGTGALLPGRVVTAARAAGLAYLQHIIAMRAHLHGDHLVAAPTRDDLAQAATAQAAGMPVHRTAHTDVLVFTAPDFEVPA
ncbi:MAG TPA: hypothetical protein VFX70_12735 [Mycobacteriales bacterium]|nr:hypothetical protein [Mycobacteriales bacterium]